MRQSETIGALAKALAAAQAEIENAHKTSDNPFFRSKYADLAEILNTSRPVLAKHGLSVVQSPGLEGETASVETLLLHESGEWISGVITSPLSKQYAKDGRELPPSPQAVGSSITYLRRYALAAFVGIAQEDDDGNEGSGARAEPQQARASNGASKPSTLPASNDPTCPACDGPMWNNLEKKAAGQMKATAPDFKCKKKDCEGVFWPGEPSPTELAPTEGQQPALAIDEQVVKIAQLKTRIVALRGDASSLDALIKAAADKALTAVRAANAIAKAERWIAEQTAEVAAAVATEADNEDLPF